MNSAAVLDMTDSSHSSLPWSAGLTIESVKQQQIQLGGCGFELSYLGRTWYGSTFQKHVLKKN